jgi:hypothetical protein
MIHLPIRRSTVPRASSDSLAHIGRFPAAAAVSRAYADARRGGADVALRDAACGGGWVDSTPALKDGKHPIRLRIRNHADRALARAGVMP